MTITDLTITDGSGGTGERGRGGGLHIEGSTVTIRNVVIRDNLRHGLLATENSTVTIWGSQIINNRPSPDGHLGRGITLSLSTTATIENNTISGNAAPGISVLSSTAQIRNNTIRDNGNDGINVLEFIDSPTIPSKATIENNTITGNTRFGVGLWGMTQVTIENNTISDNGDRGIGMTDSAQAAIQNNKISRNKHGIVMFKSSQSRILDNTITINVDWGIWVEKSSNIVECLRNTVTGNGKDFNDEAAKKCR